MKDVKWEEAEFGTGAFSDHVAGGFYHKEHEGHEAMQIAQMGADYGMQLICLFLCG